MNSLLRPALLAAYICCAGFVVAEETPDEKADTPFTTQSLRGRVVYMAEALERLHGITSVVATKENTLVLETPNGELFPLVEDKLGHAFRLDDRLMGRPVELFVRRREGLAALQVIRVYFVEKGKAVQVDYWCDICAIPMFELKPCDCCQGPIRLRKRHFDDEGQPLPEEGLPPSD